jgi:hypothetical protein
MGPPFRFFLEPRKQAPWVSEVTSHPTSSLVCLASQVKPGTQRGELSKLTEKKGTRDAGRFRCFFIKEAVYV